MSWWQFDISGFRILNILSWDDKDEITVFLLIVCKNCSLNISYAGHSQRKCISSSTCLFPMSLQKGQRRCSRGNLGLYRRQIWGYALAQFSIKHTVCVTNSLKWLCYNVKGGLNALSLYLQKSFICDTRINNNSNSVSLCIWNMVAATSLSLW